MTSTLTAEPTCAPDADTLARIEKLYDAGQYLQAYRESEAVGPLERWEGTVARVFAGRLAANLGGGRLARYLFLTAWRRDPHHPRSCWFHARHLLDTRGVWDALRFMHAAGGFADAATIERAHWLALHAHVYGRARDFDNAERWLAQAEGLASDDPWILLERAALSSMEDREEDGIRAARRALEIQPWHRPAIQWLAHFLVQKEHDDEAMQLLQEASRRTESYAVTSQLAELQLETGRYQEARDNFEEAVRQAPLLDKIGKQGLAARRCEAAYFCGDLAKAIEWAVEAKSRFYEVQAERLKEATPDRKRVCLPVGFVRQHHWTCAPATMAAICRFWAMPGDHLEVAASITYAGTPNHSERQWAIDNGWFTREFTVTWDSTRTLIDAGIPFSLTTPEVSSSHLQAVIGYDDIRGTIIIRDPGERHQVEMLAEGLERYRSSGPRGLAMVPMAEKERLESLTLPDSEIFDQIFRVERALEKHDRAGAEATYRQLIASAGEHRIAILAERVLAAYDADSVRLLACYDKLLTLFPEDLRVQLAKVSSLRDLARHSEFVELLGQASNQKISDPAFWEQYADELAEDGRTQREAEHWLKRTIRANPGAARAISTLSRILWSRRRHEDALELARLAACMEDTTEWLARNYFEYANYLGRSEEGLDFLRRRF
ncbi:MAG TPA: CDC27 family protein, partial [Gemmataceae bacterium]|nr:CDC27 family protein [Gemmataceae bacterium]